MKLLWLTDTHFDFLSQRNRAAFLSTLVAQGPQAVLLGGDLSTAPRLAEDLELIRGALKVPVYFVLGNHDYYDGSIADVREQMRSLSRNKRKLVWLEDVGYAHLGGDLALVGHGCWGDGRLGNYWGSSIELSDFALIQDFKGLRKSERLPLLNRLGDEAAAYLGRFCREAARHYRRVLVLTHTVPFPETCLHEGRVDPQGLPFFCCQKAGEALIAVATEFPDVDFTILSGHTHSHANRQILPNLLSRVQGAQYYKPGFELWTEDAE